MASSERMGKSGRKQRQEQCLFLQVRTPPLRLKLLQNRAARVRQRLWRHHRKRPHLLRHKQPSPLLLTPQRLHRKRSRPHSSHSHSRNLRCSHHQRLPAATAPWPHLRGRKGKRRPQLPLLRKWRPRRPRHLLLLLLLPLLVIQSRLRLRLLTVLLRRRLLLLLLSPVLLPTMASRAWTRAMSRGEGCSPMRELGGVFYTCVLCCCHRACLCLSGHHLV